jgi:epoxyqueuosine reductase
VDARQLTLDIKRRAAQLGFDACGVARAEPLPEDRLAQWLALGYHGTMTYLARDPGRRVDPAALLPGARSVICVALLYGQAEPEEGIPEPRLRGEVSAYARGVDYHEVLRKRLGELLAFIRSLSPGVEGRVYADTGPLLEKSWAVRAGLGWQAKNTNVLNRRLGSWFFLGEILVDLALDYDQPAPDHCGSCTRCIDACPTGALAPYVLDSRRCVSYLTIESREDTPVAFREAMGLFVFGCDICQKVCPWNRKAPPSTAPELRAESRAVERDLVKLAAMRPADFSSRYRRSAIKRATWSGLMRNVAIALGNSRDEEAIGPLGGLLEADDPMVRRHAAWGLARIGGEVAFRRLTDRRARETDATTLRTLEEILRLREPAS